MLRTRVITAFVLIALFLSALFGLPRFGWALFTLAVALVALWEWSQIAKFTGNTAKAFLGISFLAGCAFLYSFSNEGEEIAVRIGRYVFIIGTIIASVFWIIVVPLWLKFAWQPKNGWIVAATGWVVIFPMWFAMIVFRDQGGPWTVLGLMSVVWIADTAAYFSGRAFGKHKLAPSISPGKTWEGVAGAMLGVSIYVGVLICVAARNNGGSLGEFAHVWPLVIFAGLVLTLLSILGDLFESWMKRGAGLKDSSNLLPGHGGVLDRVDALTSTLPVAPLLFAAVRYASA